MKWPWNRPQPAPQHAPTLPQAVEDRLRAIEARLTDMTASTGLLRVEWAEVLDKINRWASRQAGRLGKQAKMNLDAAASESSEDGSGATNGPQAGQPLTKADLRRLAASRRFPVNGGRS